MNIESLRSVPIVAVTNKKPKGGMWQLALVHEPKFCPEAVREYLSIRGTRYPSIIKNVRRHLRYLGWKIECMICRGVFRYTSPDGKLYLSLRQACRQLVDSVDDDVRSEVSEDDHNVVSSPKDADVNADVDHDISTQVSVPFYSDSLDTEDEYGTEAVQPSESLVVEDQYIPEAAVVEAEYCPEAVAYWYKHGLERKRKSNGDMLMKAKKHLSFMGWKFWYVKKGERRELRYTSPSGRVYYSLRTACKGCIVDEERIASTKKDTLSVSPFSSFKPQGDLAPLNGKRPFTEPSDVSQPNRKRKNNLSEKALNERAFLSEPSHEKAIRIFKKTADDQKRRRATRVMTSSKRARCGTVPSPSNYRPRTVLSWLIDNNVVLPRAKVYYRSKDGPLRKGRMGYDGIKCDCCGDVFTVSGFEAHAGSQKHRPTANIYLEEDGRSLLECQKEILGNKKVRSTTRKHKNDVEAIYQDKNDEICSVCHYGGELILCDNCPSSFHTRCLGLQVLPHGNWYCPSCCCGICRKGKFEEKTQGSTDDDSDRICDQCEHKFHMGCVRKTRLAANLSNCSQNKWFCSNKCETIYSCLHEILGKPFPLGVDNLTWRLYKSMGAEDRKSPNDSNEMEALMENQSKLNVALDVMHECFEPVKDVLTGRDLVADVIFNQVSNLKRLNFQGFYTVLLERKEEVISVATVRIYEKVAEVPLVATRTKYRRLGMCRALINELEKLLTELGVERLVLPAVSDVLDTWITKFGFSKMTHAERLQYLDYTFLDFQETTMCHKFLRKISLARLEHLLPWKQ